VNDQDVLPVPPTNNPFAMASVVASLVGGVVYCCGSFMCLGWLAFFIWFVGAILGGVALSQGAQGSSRTVAIVGLVLNVVFGLGAVVLMVVGVGFGVLSGLLNSNQY
jgi:hypothetical protein